MLDPMAYYRGSRWLYLHGIPFLPRVIDRLNEFVFHCCLPHTTEIGEGSAVGQHGIGVNLHPRARIGRNVFIGSCVTVGGRSQKEEVPRIHDNVYIAAGAKVLGGIVVGEGSVVGANAVVIQSIPPRSAAAGVPARIVRENVDVYELTGWPRKAILRSRPLHPPGSSGGEKRLVRVFSFVESFNAGGSESQAVQVARRLDPKRFRVTVGCLGADGHLIEELQRAQIPVVEFPTRGSLLRPRAAYQLLRLAYFLRRGRFDVVHTHDLTTNLLGVLAAWLARTPVIISSRRDLAHWWWYTVHRRKILRYVQNLSTSILANSDAVRDFLVREDGFNASKIRVIRNAVDFGRFANIRVDRERLFPGLTHNHKLIAVVANMNVLIKGHNFLIEAARTICQVIPETRFVLIGDGAQRPKLEQMVREFRLQEYFLFLGRRRDVPELLSCCDLSVLASTTEGLPNAVLEYLAAGHPVVATRAGGTPEIIEDGVSGLLVPPRDPRALAQAVLQVLQDVELAKRLGRAGKERVRNQFSYVRLLVELQGFYEELLHRRGVCQDATGYVPESTVGIHQE